MKKIAIAIAKNNDNPLIWQRINKVVDSFVDYHIVGYAKKTEEVASLCLLQIPEILIIDYMIDGEPMISFIPRIKKILPDVKIIIFIQNQNRNIIPKLVLLGVDGITYILLNFGSNDNFKNNNNNNNMLIKTNYLDEDNKLTSREMEVLILLSKGMKNNEIGNKLFISERTVRAHVEKIMEKLNVSNRTEAVIKASKKGIIYLYE